jgi:hypothetical protein
VTAADASTVKSDTEVRKEVAELRARGEDAAARERLKRWRMEKDAAKAAPDEGGRWLSDLERSLLRFHQAANQSRRHGRAHRLPFVQCRQCDDLRREATSSKRRELEGAPTLPS